MFAAGIVAGRRVSGSVRRARREDGPAVARRLVGTGVVSVDAGHVLVLDVDGLVAAGRP
jgi:hypothetical protein